jgi:hypothetical protein
MRGWQSIDSVTDGRLNGSPLAPSDPRETRRASGPLFLLS